MRDSPARPVPKVPRSIVLAALSFGALGGGTLLASRLAEPLALLVEFAGFALYVVLFGLAMRQLPVDWNCWRDRTLDRFGSAGGRARVRRGLAS